MRKSALQVHKSQLSTLLIMVKGARGGFILLSKPRVGALHGPSLGSLITASLLAGALSCLGLSRRRGGASPLRLSLHEMK